TPCMATSPGCKLPGCELDPADATHGICVATHSNAPDSTPCTDTDNNASTTAGCESGSCVQTHIVNAPTGCRVTGGGKIFDVDPRTKATYATHGGQVGASIGVATPFTPDSACIKGQWTHVRHIPGADGNFHGSNFDSLECACLPCG